MRLLTQVLASILLLFAAMHPALAANAQGISTAPGGAIQLAKPANGPMSDAAVNQQFTNARGLINKSQWLPAETLLRECAAQRPNNGLYAEELANALIGHAAISDEPMKRTLSVEARAWYRKAAELGNNSAHVQIMLEMFDTADKAPAVPPHELSQAEKTLMEAEEKFKHGELDTAMPIYDKAIREDPKLYQTPLFAGDAAYKLKRYNDAARYYALAITINPNRETAYRYWGDSLVAAGNPSAAEDKYLEAVISEPYARTSWAGLQQWAQITKRHISSPAIKLPNSPTVDTKRPGNINITMSPTNDGDPNTAAWMTYQLTRAAQMGGGVKSGGHVGRHTLNDEVDALRAVIAASKEQKISPEKLDPSIVLLRKLDADGMLECWILLNHADQGIAQDYVAYREAHRPLLHAYLAKYVVE